MTINLSLLGEQLRLVDHEIMDLVLKRIQLAKQVGFCKYLTGDEISRPSVEDVRIENIKRYAEKVGLNPNLAAALLYSLIDESCKEQMIQLQRGNLLKENLMQLAEYGNETVLATKSGSFKAFNLNPRSLSAKDRDFVFNLIYPVAQSAFGQRHSEAFANDVRVHALDHKEILVAQNEKGEAIGFRVWDVFSEHTTPIIYLAGMCVSQEYQKGGLGPAMIHKAIEFANQSHPGWGYVVLRTQNWSMQKSMARVAAASGVYQKFGDSDISPDIQLAAKCVAGLNNDPYFEPSLLVSRGIYGASLYGKEENFESGFEGLNVSAGDAAYCVWRR